MTKRTIIKLVIAIILTGVMYTPVSKAVVVVAATNAAANQVAQNAARHSQISNQQSQRIDFPEDKEPDAQYGFVTCGTLKRDSYEVAGNTGCLVDTDDSAFKQTMVETPYKDWPRKMLGIKDYRVIGVQYDHYNKVSTVYFEYR